MASYLVPGLVLICLCLHAFVFGAQGRELEGLKKERQLLSLHHNDSTVTTIQEEEIVSHTKGLVIDQGTSQRNLPSKSRGYTKYFASNHPHDAGLPTYTEHLATYQSVPGEYYGTKATINVWNFQDLKSDEGSSALIWVVNVGDGSPENTNTVQAGWQVNPELYHDSNTHFFTLWTADGYQNTGCYDLRCPGFVLNNSSRLIPGNRLDPTSNYGGTQDYLTLKIYKDPKTGDWLLFEGSGDAPNFIGYWPKSLFTSLANSASRIDWGGTVSFTQFDRSPPMGSGHFPIEDEGKAASFKYIQYVNNKGDLEDPIDGNQVAYVDKNECYTVGAFRDSGEHGGSDGYVFYFGGPGGCNN